MRRLCDVPVTVYWCRKPSEGYWLLLEGFLAVSMRFLPFIGSGSPIITVNACSKPFWCLLWWWERLQPCFGVCPPFPGLYDLIIPVIARWKPLCGRGSVYGLVLVPVRHFMHVGVAMKLYYCSKCLP